MGVPTWMSGTDQHSARGGFLGLDHGEFAFGRYLVNQDVLAIEHLHDMGAFFQIKLDASTRLGLIVLFPLGFLSGAEIFCLCPGGFCQNVFLIFPCGCKLVFRRLLHGDARNSSFRYRAEREVGSIEGADFHDQGGKSVAYIKDTWP
jgi:hypothetical protein